ARTRRNKGARAFQLHDADAADVHRRERLEKTKRGRFDAQLARRVQNGRAFADSYRLSIDGDFTFAPRRGWRNLRHGRARHRRQQSRRLQLLAHENKLQRSIAERMAVDAVCPSPQIEASRIACAISFSIPVSCAREPSGWGATSRCSASSWRTVPTRHGTHCPHVSLRKNAAIRKRIVFRSVESSKSITTPDPSVAPIVRVPSNVSGVSSSFGETKLPAAPPRSTAC